MGQLIFSKQFPRWSIEIYNEKPNFPLFALKQVHGCHLIKIDDNVLSQKNDIEADGHLIEAPPHLPLAIQTADCVPVLIMGQRGTAFIHAGWRGLANNILIQPAIQELIPTCSWIGPHIHHCCYEVQRDFQTHFKNHDVFVYSNGKIYFDMFKEITHQLTSSFPTLSIETTQICTCCNSQYHSYRRNKTSLRNWSILKYLRGDQ